MLHASPSGTVTPPTGNGYYLLEPPFHVPTVLPLPSTVAPCVWSWDTHAYHVPWATRPTCHSGHMYSPPFQFPRRACLGVVTRPLGAPIVVCGAVVFSPIAGLLL